MKKPPAPHDPIEAMGEAYEILLEKSLEEVHKIENKGSIVLHNIIDQAKKDADIISTLGKDEADQLALYLKRDLNDAALYLNQTGKELKDWFDFDVALIKDQLHEMFVKAADKTSEELLELKYRAEMADYHTGELTGPGTLVCDKCQEKLHFHKPGHIPPCPKCHGTHFHRDHVTG